MVAFKSCIGEQASELRILLSISLFVLLNNDGTRPARAAVLPGADRSQALALVFAQLIDMIQSIGKIDGSSVA